MIERSERIVGLVQPRLASSSTGQGQRAPQAQHVSRVLRADPRERTGTRQQEKDVISTYLADKAENLTVEGPSAAFTYRRMGPQGGLPFVLLQRFRATIDWWDPEFLDYLAADHDVIVFDNVGAGYTTGEPRDSIDGFAEGAAEFIEALGLGQADVLGWSLGGFVAQRLAARRPELVRKIIVAGSGPNGWVPGAPEASQKVSASWPSLTPTWRTHCSCSTRRRKRPAPQVTSTSPTSRPGSPPAAPRSPRRRWGMLAAIGQLLAALFGEVKAELESFKHPALYANGLHDVMVPAHASYVAVQHLADATLLLYGDAGHAFLFQHAKAFTKQVTDFLAA